MGFSSALRIHLRELWVKHLQLVYWALLGQLHLFRALTLVSACVGVWFCAPGRLELTWDTNFTVR